jgi:hypothetical protein
MKLQDLIKGISTRLMRLLLCLFACLPWSGLQAELAGLAVTDGTLAPAFSTLETSYDASVPFRTTGISVIPVEASPGTTIRVRVNGGSWTSVASAATSPPLALAVGDNIVEVESTDAESEITLYEIEVARAAEADDPVYRYDFDSDGILPNLTIFNNTGQPNSNFYTVSGGVLQQDTSTVAGNISFLFPDVSSTGGGFSQAKATYAEARLKITSASGDSGIYLAIYDGGKSYTANFSATGVTVGSTFVPLTDIGNFHTYRLESPPNSSILYLYRDGVLTISTTAASAPYNGFGWGDGSSSGGNHGVADWDYIEFGQLSTYTPPPSDAELADLTLIGAELSPVFDVNVSNYSLSVPNATSNIRVIPTIAAAGMTVTVNGEAVVSGVQGPPVILNVGENLIPVVVTGLNQVTSKTYTISILRAEPVLAVTGAASALTGMGATLNGTVTPNAPATVHFEYGTTAAYGMSTPPQVVSGNVEIPVSAELTGLAGDAVYHYRLVVTTEADGVKVSGGHRSFTLGTPPASTGPGVIDDAVFAHDFEEVIDHQITSLAGPAATKSAAIVAQTGDGLPFSPGFLRFPIGYDHAKIDTGVRLDSPTSELSFTIRYNGRGDNGSDGGFVASSDVRLLSTFNGGGNDSLKPPDAGPYFGIEDHEGNRRLVFRTQYEKFYSTAAVPAGDSVWHQAAFTFREGVLKFYFDGDPLGDPVDLSGAGLLLLPAQGFDWTIGEDPQVGNTNRGAVADDYFDGGDYDEAALWNRALTAEEILSIHEIGLAETPRFPEAELPGTDYNVLVKRLDFSRLEASPYFIDPEVRPFWPHQPSLPQIQISDGLLKFRNFDDPGNNTYLMFERLNQTGDINQPGNVIIDPNRDLLVETEITAHRFQGGGTYFQVSDGQFRYSLALDSAGFSVDGFGVPVPVMGRHVYRLESPANSPTFRIYVDDVLKFVGTAPPSSEQKFILGDYVSDSDISFLEIRQADPSFVAGEEVAIHWEGDTPAGLDDYRWVQGGNWGFAIGDHEVGPVPQRADNVVFDLPIAGMGVSVSSTQRATSQPSPHAARIKGLRLNQEDLLLYCPKRPGRDASIGVHVQTIVEKNATITVEGRPGFFYTDSLHVSGTAIEFVAPLGRIDGRLSGGGEIAVTVLDVPPVPSEPYPIPPYPFPESLAVFGIHSPGGTLAHLDADYVPGVGLQTIDGNLRYEENSSFEWQLASSYQDSSTGTRGTDYDAVTVSGDLAGSKARFRIVLPGDDDFSGDFWTVRREWDDIFAADNLAEVNLGEIFTSFEYANEEGLLTGDRGPQRWGYFKRSGTSLIWEWHDGELAQKAYPAYGWERLRNGGAESGSLSGWTGSGISVVPAELAVTPDAVDGSTGRFIFKAENRPGSSEISQRIELPAAGGDARRFGFRGMILSRASDGIEENGEIEVTFRGPGDEALGAFTLSDGDKEFIDWQMVEESGAIPPGATAADIVLRATATAGAANRVAFDNLSFVLTGSTFFRKVDLDASLNGPAQPVTITLDPGSYVVRPSTLGRFSGWHGWLGGEGSEARNDTSGTNYTRGWRWSYAISTAPGVSRTVPVGLHDTYYEDAELAYQAVAASGEVRYQKIELTEPRAISFHIPEESPADNGGGISLVIERAGEQDDALAHLLGPVAYESFEDDSPLRSVRFGAGGFQHLPGTLNPGALPPGVTAVSDGPAVTTIEFTGTLPTHAGIVWSGSSAPNGVTVEFFNADGLLVATVGPARVDGSGTFFGAVYRGGIARIRVTAPGGTVVLSGLQYGVASEDSALPEFDPAFAKELSPLLPGEVTAVLDLPGGDRIVGGRFTDAGGQARGGIARVSAGQVTGWQVVLGGALPEVRALALDGDRLFIGGSFSSVNGQPRQNLAVVSLADPTVTGVALDMDSPVVAMAGGSDVLFVATAEEVVRFDLTPTTIIAADWSALPAWLSSPEQRIETILTNGAHLLVGGRFPSLQAQPASGLARIDAASGAVDVTWLPELDPGGIAAADEVVVKQLIEQGGELYVVGDYAGLPPAGSGFVRKLDPSDGDLDPAWAAVTGREVRGAAVASGHLYLGDGEGEVTRFGLSDGAPDLAWSRGVGGPVGHLHASGTFLHVFGSFNRTGPVPALAWVEIDTAGSAVLPVAPVGLPGEILCFARQPDGKLLAGGDFMWAQGEVADGLVRLMPGSDRLDPDWRPRLAGGAVRALAIAGDEIFVGGSFTEADGVAGSLVKYELFADGQPDDAWMPEVSDVTAIATSRDHIFAAGNFAGGSLRRIWRSSGEVDPAWGTAVTNEFGPVEVRTLQSHGEHLYLGGVFTGVQAGVTRTSIARVDLATGVGDSWNPNLFEPGGAAEVNAILFHRDLLYLAGKFQAVQGTSQPNLVRLNIEGSVDISWRPSIPGPQHALLAVGENLFSAGTAMVTMKTNVTPVPVTALDASDGVIRAVIPDEGRIVAGGSFVHFGGKRLPGLAASPFLGSPRVSFRDGRVFIYPDDGTGPFVGGFRITGLSGGTLFDPAAGEFYEEGDVVPVEAGSVGLIWEPSVAGTPPVITVASVPPAGLDSPDLNPLTTQLAVDPGTPSFQFELTDMEVHEGDLFTAFVSFPGDQPPPESVFYEILPSTARRFDGTSGDYVDVVQPLRFEWNALRQTYQAPLRIPVLEDKIAEGAEEFFVRLVQPAAGFQLGPKNLLRVRLIDGARASGGGAPPAVLDPLVRNAPLGRAASSQLQPAVVVGTNPGKWRLRGETQWRESGGSVSNLQNQNSHEIVYRPESGYQTPGPTRHFLGTGQTLSPAPVSYSTSSATGHLQLLFSPSSLATAEPESQRARWRVTGDMEWHDSGDLVELATGFHLIEFQGDIPGRITPAPRPVLVSAAETRTIRESYLPTRVPAAALSPVSAEDDPARYVGRFETDFGFATGTAVSEQTVLTAARAMWDPDRLALSTRATWLHQPDPAFRPAPRYARSALILSGYAQQLEADRQAGTGVNSTGNLLSDNLDVAVAYFFGPTVARGGYSGFLADYSPASGFNPWLRGGGGKQLIGYPLSGVASPGLMHASASFTTALEVVQNHVHSTTAVQGLPGMEGSPLFCAHPNGHAYPAAIYLGENQSARFRALDGSVAELIYRAEFIAALANFSGGTGGGDEYDSQLTGDDFPIGFVQVDIPLGVGRWRVVDGEGEPVTVWFYSGEFAPVIAGEWQIEFEEVAGLATPASRSVTVVASQMSEPIVGNYPLTFEVWSAGVFDAAQLADPLVSGPEADPDGDGIVNLLEFAFGLEPEVRSPLQGSAGVKGMPVTTVTPPTMTVEFLRRSPLVAPVLEYIVEFSDDLGGSWTPVTDAEVEAVEGDPAWESVRATIPASPASGRRFSRVRVQEIPPGS